MEDVLRYSKDETLELIRQTLENNEVKRNLPIIRAKFIKWQANECCNDTQKGQRTITTILEGFISGLGYAEFNDYTDDQNLDTIMDFLEYHEGTTTVYYNKDPQKVITEYKNEIRNNYTNNENRKMIIDAIINALINDDLKQYASDILFAYKGYQMLNKLFKNGDGKFTFDELTNILKY